MSVLLDKPGNHIVLCLRKKVHKPAVSKFTNFIGNVWISIKLFSALTFKEIDSKKIHSILNVNKNGIKVGSFIV